MQEAVLADIDNQIESQELKVRRKEGEIEELQKKIAKLDQRDTSAQVRALYWGRPHRVRRVPYFVALAQHSRVNAQEAELKRSITALSSEHNLVKQQIHARRCMQNRACASVRRCLGMMRVPECVRVHVCGV